MLTDPYSVEATALKCKKVLSVLKATPLKKGIEEHYYFSYCTEVSCSVSLAMD